MKQSITFAVTLEIATDAQGVSPKGLALMAQALLSKQMNALYGVHWASAGGRTVAFEINRSVVGVEEPEDHRFCCECFCQAPRARMEASNVNPGSFYCLPCWKKATSP